MKRHHSSTAVLHGAVYGPAWSGQECWKHATVYEKDVAFPHGRRSCDVVREFALRACMDGDFQSCKLVADSCMSVTRTTTITDDDGKVVGTLKRERIVMLDKFPGAADLMGDVTSDELPGFYL